MKNKETSGDTQNLEKSHQLATELSLLKANPLPAIDVCRTKTQKLFDNLEAIKGHNVWGRVHEENVCKLFGFESSKDSIQYFIHFQHADRDTPETDINHYHLIELWRQINGKLEQQPIEAELFCEFGPDNNRFVIETPREDYKGELGRFYPFLHPRIKIPNPTTTWISDTETNDDIRHGVSEELTWTIREHRLAARMAQLLLDSDEITEQAPSSTI